MDLRYSLLPYTYTLFYKANCAGETVLRALAWEFPDDPQLKSIETQFMSGPAILVTPVLAPLATTVQGVFPGVANGTKWYDIYNLEQVDVQPGENKTLDAPLTKLNVHARSGYVIPMQQAGNTTRTSRQNPWSLLVTLDDSQCADGELYLDDGVTLNTTDTKTVEVSQSGPYTVA
jgi:alpha-glucosidase